MSVSEMTGVAGTFRLFPLGWLLFAFDNPLCTSIRETTTIVEMLALSWHLIRLSQNRKLGRNHPPYLIGPSCTLDEDPDRPAKASVTHPDRMSAD